MTYTYIQSMQIASASRAPVYPAPAPREEKEWTVLYVFNGDNDLKENTSHQLKDVAAHGAPEDSYVAAFAARGDLEWSPGNIGRKLRWHIGKLRYGKKQPVVPSDWSGNRVFHITKAGALPEPLAAPEGKVSQPATINDFLQWGMKEYPSKKLAVIFSGHGDAHRGFFMDSKGKEMPLSEVGKLVSALSEQRGKPVDLLGFESCNMGQAEVAYEFSDSVEAMVASPTVLYGTPWDHSLALQSITSAPDGRTAAIELVKAADRFNEGTPTISAIDLQKMPKLRDALGELGQAITESQVPEHVLERMIYNARSYGRAQQGAMKPQRELVDLHSFCQQVISHERSGEGPHKDAALKVQELLGEVVPEFMDRESSEGGHGLSVYLPTMRGLFKKLPDEYTNLKMSQDGQWDEFIANW